jgi:hypothetical protein
LRRVLFDEDVPRQLRRDLPEFYIKTVQECGWSSIQNGDLLRLASSEYDVLVTADKNLRYQQHIASFDIGVVVLATLDTRLPRLQTVLLRLRTAIITVTAGEVVVITGP